MRFLVALAASTILVSTAAQAEIVYSSFRDNGDGSVTFREPVVVVSGSSYAIAPASGESVCSILGYAYSLSSQYRRAWWGGYDCVRVRDGAYGEVSQSPHVLSAVTCTNYQDLVELNRMGHRAWDWDEVFGRN